MINLKSFIFAIFLLFSTLAQAAGLEAILNGPVSVKILSGLILLFVVISFVLIRRLAFKPSDLWKSRKKLDIYQHHIEQIDSVLARALELGKMKKSGDAHWIEKKTEIEAEIKELLKQSPLGKLPQDIKNTSKLDIRAKLSDSKLSGKQSTKQ
ncbi:MAG: hypothetical protein A2X86_21115 [Bdellovibrionales bacterium GWA2_49_15]|nr:MAG: hypothetical protein A2X86_21115 [Bdellovibrionales bacterium GWA2_49_15]HAZ14879.1 hypothetical protein [Bdellovibrionales bacterium]